MKNLNPNLQFPKDTRPFAQQLEEARYFFAAPNLRTADDNGGQYSDKDGLVQFIVAGELLDNEFVMKKLADLKKNLVALTSIVTDYVNRYAATYGQTEKTNIKVWEYAMSKLPLMGPGFIENQMYTRQSLGISISKDFIEFLMGVIVSQGSNALSGFQKFLEKQGDALELGISQNKDGYNVIAIGVTAEVFTLGNEIVYTPKIQQYKINFTRQNSTFNGCCAKVTTVNINFAYQHSVNIFDYEALKDPAIQKSFDDFIQNSRKAQIENADTFFNDDFPPQIA
jgi:hypothetical protein